MLTINILCLISFIILCTIVILCPIDKKYAMLCILVLIIILMGMFYIYAHIMDIKLKKIRRLLFQYKSNIKTEDLFYAMTKAFENKPDFTVQLKKDYTVSIMYKKHSFDIVIGWNETFYIWWKRLENENIKIANRYSSYYTARKVTTLIAYEIQKKFNIN